jgi:VIT1/CCC1 family predicted Fe2+/Mn2+ transporter
VVSRRGHAGTRLSEVADSAVHCEGADVVIVLGVILLILGYVLGLSILSTIGTILLVVGAVLWILGAVGRPVAGRKAWF